MRPCVYILASARNGTLYIGVTSSLADRIAVHKQELIGGFTKRYGVHRLVYYETHATMGDAIRREKQLKKWNRAWKLRIIEQMNPDWLDLFDEFWGAIADGPGDRSRDYRRSHLIGKGPWIPAFAGMTAGESAESVPARDGRAPIQNSHSELSKHDVMPAEAGTQVTVPRGCGE